MEQQPPRPPDDERTEWRSAESPGFPPAGPQHYGGQLAAKQSGLGIASFVIGLVSVIAIVVAIVTVTSALMNLVSPDMAIDQQTIMEMSEAAGPIVTAGLFILLSLALSLVGLILGIIGLFARYRRKAFGIIGVVLNAFVLIGFFGMLVLSLLMPGMAGGASGV